MCDDLRCSVDSCSDSPDYILVRDGPDSSAPVIARFCNTLNGEQIVSSGETLYVDFVVDGRKEKQGFAASYAFISSEDLLRTPRLDAGAANADASTVDEDKSAKHSGTKDGGKISAHARQNG